MKYENNKRVFNSGATKNISEGKGRYDLIPTEALVALAKRFEFGVLSGHEENGYRKGIPDSVLFDSAFRHLVQAEGGWNDEDHLAAVMWNVAVLIFNRDTKIKVDDSVSIATDPNSEHLEALFNKGEEK